MTPTNDPIAALKSRYAVNVFDTSRKISDEDLKTILESGRLSPSGFGIEPWKFLVVNDPEMRAKIREAGYDQRKISEASHLVVIATRTDAEAMPDERIARTVATSGLPESEFEGFRAMMVGAISARPAETRVWWLKAQTYIPLGIMIATASLLGIDTGPMEGFDTDAVDKLLGLREKNLTATTMLALGYRAEEPKLPKVRREYGDVVEII